MSIPIAIYPFCAEILPAVKVFEKIQNLYTIDRLISPKGFGLTDHDAGYTCNHPDTGMVVTDEFDFDNAQWTTLVLFEPIMLKEKADYSFETIAEQALKSGKYVVFLNATAQIENIVNRLSKLYPNKIEIKSYINNNYYINSLQEFHEAEVPVVLVGGVLEEADTFEVLAKLALKLKEENVNALVFSKHPIGGLLGFHNLNHIWDSTAFTEAQKINEINKYINCMVNNVRPDVILLEAPDAVVRYNDLAPNGFGVRTFMICQAVTPDKFICCLPFAFAFKEFINSVSAGMDKIIGTPITAVHASNVIVNAQELYLHNISIIHGSLNFVHEQIARERERCQIPIYDVVTERIDELYNYIFYEV